jgi:hypothetical protein
MTCLYQKTGIDDYKPAVITYNLWIHALAKSGTSAEFVLHKMRAHGVEPNSIMYTSVIDLCAKSGQVDAAQQAERVFLELLDAEVELHISSVDAILNALAIQGTLESAEHAEYVLTRLETLPTTIMQPTVHSYSTVMNAFAKCGAAEQETGAVLNACAFCPPESQRPALQIAMRTFNEISCYTRLDTISYGNLLKCVTNLMPAGKT